MKGRTNPFLLAFPDAEWREETFSAIAQEAESRGVSVDDPRGFMLLARVGASLQDLRVGEESGGAFLESHGQLLFHALQHHRRLGAEAAWIPQSVDPDAVQEVVASARSLEGEVEGGEGEGEGEAEVVSWASTSGYLQLPLNLFWVRPEGEEGLAEPLDGLSWVAGAMPGTGDLGLSVLAISGVRADRPGFSVIPVPTVPLEDRARWMRATARPEGRGLDFAPNLPGGELAGFYSVETAGELLKLVVGLVTR